MCECICVYGVSVFVWMCVFACVCGVYMCVVCVYICVGGMCECFLVLSSYVPNNHMSIIT